MYSVISYFDSVAVWNVCSMFSVSCQIICQLHDMNKKDEVFRSSMFIFYSKKGVTGIVTATGTFIVS